MNGIYKYKRNQPIVWYHKDKSKSNQWCLYCGKYIGLRSSVESNKEHLIGRSFVPRGTLDENAFNFIFRSCKKCNGEKSNIERHISSTTLINSPGRAEDSNVNEIAINKAKKDYHHKHKGKAVINSCGQQNIQVGNFIKFGFVSPPQVDNEYTKLLAFRQIQGLFSLVTSKNPTSKETTRLLPSKHFLFFESYNERDWGNPKIIELIKRTKEWPCICQILTANGYFKAMLRQSSGSKEGWFWSLEWNKYLRVVGGIYNGESIQNIFKDLPELDWQDMGKQSDASMRVRKEYPLEVQDELFLPATEVEKST